jgi:RNA polymerase sigma-70 factor (ECF subfamily)
MTAQAEAIWNQFATRLGIFIRGRVTDIAAAEDILQETFVKIQKRLGQLRDAGKLEGWVYQIARNAIMDHYRKRRETVALPESLAAETAPISDREREGLQAAFHGMIEALPPPYREAIELTSFGGLTQQELADRLGISLSGAKSRVQRGRAMLKEMLLECCRFEFDRRGGILECEPRTEASCPDCG